MFGLIISPDGTSVNDSVDSGLCSLDYLTVDTPVSVMLRAGHLSFDVQGEPKVATQTSPSSSIRPEPACWQSNGTLI